MEVLQNRTDSFKPKRVKNPAKPSSSISVKWPHSQQFIATPEVLAEAGFYYNPSYDDRDNVSCFACDKQLSNWEVEDDPFDVHWDKCGTSCCWAIVRCRLRGDIDAQRRFVSTDKMRLPTSKHMERARLETFGMGKGWVHDQVTNHGASSRKMAHAGFVYTPQHSGDDLATCLYCDVSLGGWDAADDPMEEHKKRNNKIRHPCAFFTLELTTVAKPPSRSQSKPPPKSKHKDTILPTKTHDGEPDNDEFETDPPAGSSSIRRSAKGRSISGSTRSVSGSIKSTVVAGKTPKKHTRSQSRGGLKEVAEDNEDGEGGEESEVPPARARRTTATAANKRKSRSRSKSISHVVADTNKDEEDEETDEEVVMRKASRSKSKAKEEAYIEGDGEEVKNLKKSTRAKPKAKPLSADEVVVDEDEEIEGVKDLKKSTRGKQKPKIGSTEEVKTIRGDEEVEEAKGLKKSTRAKPKPKVISAEEVEIVDDDVEEKTSRKPSRTKSKAKPVSEQEETEREETIKPPSRAGAKTPAPALRKTSRAKTKPAIVVDEEEADDAPTLVSEIEGKRTISSSSSNTKARSTSKPKSKAHTEDKAVLVESADDEEDEMDVFVSPRSSPLPLPSPSPPVPSKRQKEKEKVTEPDELAVLLIPKRNTKVKAKIQDDQVRGGGRVDDSGEGSNPKDNQEDISVEEENIDENPEPQPPKKQSSRATSSRKPSSKVQSGDAEKIKIKKPGNERKGMKVVEISTDEEGGDKLMERDDNKKDTSRGRSTMSERNNPVPKLEKEKEKKQVFVEIIQQVKVNSKEASMVSQPLPPKPPANTFEESGDVEMAGVEDELRVEDTHMFESQERRDQIHEEPPKTPPHSTAINCFSHHDLRIDGPLPPVPIPAPVLPPLSKLPFTPIHNLSDAELDMTVEEWIRYQMEVEYDKFRRDGERELGRFRKKAEEVRVIIEGL